MDLAQAFELARQADPSFQSSRQELAGLNEVVPQARAALLPNVSASASRNRVWLDRQEQGGEFESNYFSLNNSLVVRQPLYAPIRLESNNGLSNLRGTLAMARRSDADSATSQFFFNVVDNTSLDYQSAANPGYAVFGRIISGLATLDAINVVPTYSYSTTDIQPRTEVLVYWAQRLK